MKTRGHVVMAASYSPYWKVEIDGAPAKVLIANASFMAAEVSEGKHQIVWRYRPPWAL
jgi:uncharacterized membrane protein YfhO